MNSFQVGIPLIHGELSGRDGWIAGFYYIRNCLNALATLTPSTVPQIVVFKPETLQEPLIFPEYQNQATWLTEVVIPEEVLVRAKSKNLKQYIEPYPCDLIFPLTSLPLVSFSAPVIGWIPDFQHKVHPQFFSEDEIHNRDLFNNFAVNYCNKIVCISQTVKDDLDNYYPHLAEQKGAVIRFRVVLPEEHFKISPESILSKFGITAKFAYLPNQFWKHKNHKTVFEAWKYLKSQGRDYLLVCSGAPFDYRFPNYYQELETYLDENGLRDNIKLLGFLSREEQVQLYRAASVVLQPSLFEGWGATIEEAHSLGKPIIVSDLPVHREHCVEQAIYFDKHDPGALANIVQQVWDSLPPGHDPSVEARALTAAKARIEHFGRELVDLFKEALNYSQHHPHQAIEKQYTLDLLANIEADRKARYEAINYLKEKLQASEADRIARQQIIEELRGKLQASEADRIARQQIIEELRGKLRASEISHTVQQDAIKQLEKELQAYHINQGVLQEQVEQLTVKLRLSEANVVTQAKTIQAQEKILQQLPMKLLRRFGIVR